MKVEMIGKDGGKVVCLINQKNFNEETMKEVE